MSDYVTASFSADRPIEQLDDEIELLSAQLELAKALKAAAAAPLQQAAPTRRNAEPPTRYGSLHAQYGALYSFPPVSFYSQVPGAPVVALPARDAHADALLVERDSSPGGARFADLPRQLRPSAAAPASAPMASTDDSAAASTRALAAPHAAPPVSQAALQLAAFIGSSVPSHQALPTSYQSFPPFYLPGVSSEDAFSSKTPSGGTQGGGAQPPGGPPGDPDDDPDNKKRDREIDHKRNGQFLIDSIAFRSAKGRSRGNMKCEV